MKRWVMNLKESIYKRDIYEGLEGRKGREKYCKYVIISKGSKSRKNGIYCSFSGWWAKSKHKHI